MVWGPRPFRIICLPDRSELDSCRIGKMLKANCEAILDIVLRASDQCIDSVIRRLVKIGAMVVFKAESVLYGIVTKLPR